MDSTADAADNDRQPIGYPLANPIDKVLINERAVGFIHYHQALIVSPHFDHKHAA